MLHLIPEGERHDPTPGCPCTPTQVTIAVTGGRRAAWQHHETGAGVAVPAVDPPRRPVGGMTVGGDAVLMFAVGDFAVPATVATGGWAGG